MGRSEYDDRNEWPQFGPERHRLLNRAVGDEVPVPNTGFVLRAVVENGNTNAQITSLTANIFNRELAVAGTNPPSQTRLITGTTLVDMQYSAEVTFTTNATSGYISDLLPGDYQNLGHTFQDFRNNLGNPQFFGVYVLSAGTVIGRMIFRFVWDQD